MIKNTVFDWYPHFAVMSYWDGEKVVCQTAFIVFKRAFLFGRQTNIWPSQFEELK